MNTYSSRRANKQPNIRYTDDGFPVRNVYFAFEHQYLAYEHIETYFKSVGEVARFRLFPKPTHTFGFVQYHQPEHAAEVLSRFYCNINGVLVRVKEADSRHQPKVPYALTDSTAQSTDDVSNVTPVPDLNDDCLFKIFGNLNVFDLTSVAEVCPRFQSIARSQFSLKHKIFDFHELIEAAKEVKVKKIKKPVLESFLKHFGPIIVNLSVAHDSPYGGMYGILNNEVLGLIMKYCGETLTVLKLFDFSLYGHEQQLRPLFVRLQELHLIECQFTKHFVRMLEGCHRLKKLSFNDQSRFSDCKSLQFYLPELEAISFKHFGGFSKQQLKKFLEHNPQLKKVSIICCDGIKVDILSEIVRHVPHVEEISFKGDLSYASVPFIRHAMALKQLRSLKKLKLDCSGNSASSIFSEMASAKIPLEYLEVADCNDCRELISNICELKTLNAVSLDLFDAPEASHLHKVCKDLPGLTKLIVSKCPDSFNMADLITLVRFAEKLQELNFGHSFSVRIDEDSFKTLIEIIKMRPDSLPLKIFVPNRSKLLTNVSDEYVTANRDKLIINANNLMHFHCPCGNRFDDEYDDYMDHDADYMGLYDSDLEFYGVYDSDDDYF